jgi:hypothetical protein
MFVPTVLWTRRCPKSGGGILTSDFAELFAKFHRKLGLRRTDRADPALRHTPPLDRFSCGEQSKASVPSSGCGRRNRVVGNLFQTDCG